MEGDLPNFWGLAGTITATIALLCSLGGNFWCSFATRNVSFAGQRTNEVIRNSTSLTSGIWNFQDYNVWFSTDGNNLYYYTYNYCVPFRTTDVSMDSMWKAAMAFTVISAIMGGVVAIASCGIVCVTPSKVGMMLLVLSMLFVTLFQGLVFLFFASNACKAGPDKVTMGDSTFDLTWSNCVLSHAANLAVSSTVLWFVAAVLLLYASFQVAGDDSEGGLKQPAEPKDEAKEEAVEQEKSSDNEGKAAKPEQPAENKDKEVKSKQASGQGAEDVETGKKD